MAGATVLLLGVGLMASLLGPWGGDRLVLPLAEEGPVRLRLWRPIEGKRVEKAVPGELLRLDIDTIWPGNDYVGRIDSRLERAASQRDWVVTHCLSASQNGGSFARPATKRTTDCRTDDVAVGVPSQKNIVIPRDVEPGVYRLCEEFGSRHRSPAQIEQLEELPAPVVGARPFSSNDGWQVTGGAELKAVPTTFCGQPVARERALTPGWGSSWLRLVVDDSSIARRHCS